MFAQSANWIYRYNGTGNLNDCATSVVNGADGNIYAAGSSYGSSTFQDFIVISLPPSLGTTEVSNHVSKDHQYTTIINGPLHIFNGKATRIFDITGRQIHTLDPASGIYFIEIDGQIQQKVIKVR